MPDYLDFNSETGMMTFEPMLDDRIGRINILKKVSLMNYPNNFVTSNFDVTI